VVGDRVHGSTVRSGAGRRIGRKDMTWSSGSYFRLVFRGLRGWIRLDLFGRRPSLSPRWVRGKWKWGCGGARGFAYVASAIERRAADHEAR
jgi:hypothetical protein